MSSISDVNSRLAWKERRVLLPLTLSLAGIFLVSLIAIALSTPLAQQKSLLDSLFVLFVMGLCGFGLALGVLMFANEREQRTTEFLGLLPVTNPTVGRSKLTQAVTYFLLFYVAAFGLIAATFFLMHGRWMLGSVNGGRIESMPYWISALIPIECCLWSLFASQRIGNSINATLAAAALTGIGIVLATFGAGWFGFRVLESNLQWTTLPIHLVVIAAAGTLVVKQSKHWLRPETITPKSNLAGNVSATSDRSTIAAASHPFRSLLWQLWRSQRWVWFTAIVILFAAAIGVLVIDQFAFEPRGLGFTIQKFEAFTYGLAATLGALVGLSAFAADQNRHGYVFFQQRADYPNLLWITRLIPTVVVAGLLVLLLFVANWWWSTKVYQSSLYTTYYSMQQYERDQWDAIFRQIYELSIHRPLLVFFAVAGIGQLVSILVRSGVAIVIAGSGLCAATATWFYYLGWINESLWIIAWPWVVIPYLLSWLYSGDFIRGGRALRGSTASIVVLLLATGASALGLWYYRVGRIDLETDFSTLAPIYERQDQVLESNPARFDGALNLRMAMGDVVSLRQFIDQQNKSLEAGQEPLSYQELAKQPCKAWPDSVVESLSATNRAEAKKVFEDLAKPEARFYPSASNSKVRESQLKGINQLIHVEIESNLRRQNIEGALDGLIADVHAIRLEALSLDVAQWVRWIQLPGQTTESLAEGMDRLETAIDEVFDPEVNLERQWQYYSFRKSLDSLSAKTMAFGPERWELQRAEKVYLAAVDNASEIAWEMVCKAMTANSGTIYREWDTYRNRWPAPWRNGYPNQKANKQLLDRSTWKLVESLAPENSFAPLKQDLNYIKLRIGLRRHYLDHGAYPEQLKNLSGKYFESIPIDPLTGMDFAYYPDGFEAPVVVVEGPVNTLMQQNIKQKPEALPAGEPFVLPFSGTVHPQLIQMEIADLGRVYVGTIQPSGTYSGRFIERGGYERFCF